MLNQLRFASLSVLALLLLSCSVGATTTPCEESECDGPSADSGGGAFRCDGNRTFDHDVTCDTIADCVDGSDESAATCPLQHSPQVPVEAGLPGNPAPGYGKFVCDDGEEIEKGYVCDAWENCTGGEDEARCFYCDTSSNPNDSVVIRRSHTCDGINDCAGAPDEAMCDPSVARPESFGFLCADGTTIATNQVCDSTPDCAGAEDEDSAHCFSCAYAVTHTIRIAEHCDGIVDCYDASDEDGCNLPTAAEDCVQTVSELAAGAVTDACLACACGNAVAAASVCTSACWGYLTCQAQECTSEGSSRLCTSECMGYLSGQNESVRLRRDLAGACDAACPDIAAIDAFLAQ